MLIFSKASLFSTTSNPCISSLIHSLFVEVFRRSQRRHSLIYSSTSLAIPGQKNRSKKMFDRDPYVQRCHAVENMHIRLKTWGICFCGSTNCSQGSSLIDVSLYSFPLFINWFADYCRVRWAGDEVKASIGGFLPLLTAFNTHWERYLIAVLSLIPYWSHLPNSDPAGEKYPYDSVWDELQTALTDSDVMCCDPPVLCSRLWPGSLERASTSALQLPGRYLMSM